MQHILLIEDELVLAKNAARYLELQGHAVAVAHDGLSGLAMAQRNAYDLLIVDYQLPSLDGLEVIRELRRIDCDAQVIMVTGHGSINLAVQAMKAGATDLLTKPLALGALGAAVEVALARRRKWPAREARTHEGGDESIGALLGECPQMQNLRALVRAMARSEPPDGPPPTVLVQGETGTGKELVARACHLASPRASGPFIEVNCAALPASLMEDELFGHEKGAFTDARARKPGLIEAADGGVLFLDEIGELELALQSKLLRVLENLKVRPIGALQDRRVNARIVAATNRDLAREVDAGRFRADLLYRLGVFQIRVPPLRERGDDVILLAKEFLRTLAARYDRPPMTLEPDAIAALRAHDWPGNVRELRNCLERAILTHRAPRLRADDLGLALRPRGPGHSPHADAAAPAAAGTSLEALERQHLLDALVATGWNVSLAARVLQVTRDTLRYRMWKHGLERGETR